VDTMKRPDVFQLLLLLKHLKKHVALSEDISDSICPIQDLVEEKSVGFSGRSQGNPAPNFAFAGRHTAVTVADFENEIVIHS
jgi:hypothetical protein